MQILCKVDRYQNSKLKVAKCDVWRYIDKILCDLQHILDRTKQHKQKTNYPF